ncbi:isopentenyl-diphosphate delta-isomerase [Morganella morganii]|uniref:Isopentenyl-diphosphate Delta-isomerase n=2 Tax=Morganella morganii TaxID=582 RepID=A0A8I0PTX3_MORMO|nr:isopentenyl-diphosphate delta-isomerase [Morganella morganii]
MKRRRYIPAFLCHYSGKLSAAYLLQYIFQPLYRIKDIMSDELILVDEYDNTLGYDEKLRVHQLGLLHRAFSVFLFNDAGELLIQQRALSKYHSGGLWANSCCSHPRRGESLEQATQRRLQEELGITCPLRPAGHIIYRANVPPSLTEHEYDHLFTGHYNGPFSLNPQEVSAVRWISLTDLKQEMRDHPQQFAEWFKVIAKKFPLLQITTS